MRQRPLRVLIVDLNNFARYPTIAVGYLAAILRASGATVEVLSPLGLGVPGVPREPRAGSLGLLDQRIRYWTALSPNPLVRRARAAVVRHRRAKQTGRRPLVADELRARLNEGFDAVLISAYLMYHSACEDLGRVCAERRVPMLLGGAYFFQPQVSEAWRSLPGLSAIVGGEVEPHLPDLVRAAVDRGDLSRFPGIVLPDGRRGPVCPPLKDLDALPFPDFEGFPWHKYPNRIVPVITGRGCGWGACTFCSDVTSSMGRTFRTRTPGNVLDEIEHQARKHAADLFVFCDLKLNSDLRLWRALADGFQDRAPGARWIAAVHVGAHGEHGLGREELVAARRAGAVRLTTGLESGSQRILDAMRKGADLAVTSQFLADAFHAGISVRTTMVLGYPGEEPDDVLASARFLEEHATRIDRVSLNRLQIITGTRLHRQLERKPDSMPGVVELTVDHRSAGVEHRYEPASSPHYRRAVTRLLRAVHRINRRPLRKRARDFEGVM